MKGGRPWGRRRERELEGKGTDYREVSFKVTTVAHWIP
jgi:hypothetical protein